MSAKSSPETARPAEPSVDLASFQQAVSDCLIRHRSVLDVMSKFQETGARVNRAVAKAVTSCGCVQVDAGRQTVPANISYWEMKEHMETHVKGEMCEHCREVLEQEIGRNLYYLTALCDLFGLRLERVLQEEQKRIATLGVFNLT
ncbi:MAG: DUF1573 domain-containing protein [Clostridia bacterium]|mgnify:CR=1 FL=1